MRLSRFGKIAWSSLGKVHAIEAVRTTYLWVFAVPILAKALENVGGQVRLMAFGHAFELTLELPFSWIAFYFSALFFAAGEALYNLRCPRIVRDQSTYRQFREEGKGVDHLDDYIYEIGMNWEDLRQQLERRDEYFGVTAEAENPRSDDRLLRNQFWTAYRRGDQHRALSKALCAFLYAVGVALIFYVVAQNLEYVIRYLCTH